MTRLNREKTYHKAYITIVLGRLAWLKQTCSEDDGNKCDVKDIKNEEKSAKIQMYKLTLMNFCPSISSQLLTGSCKGKQILVRTCWRTSWLYSTERYYLLLVVYPLSDSSNDMASFISAKKPWERNLLPFFELKSVVQFLKHCYSIPANRKLTSLKITEK